VRAGVVQVFALEQDARAAGVPGQAFGEVDRAWPADVMLQVFFEFGDEGRIDARGVVGRGQFLQRADQGFGDETPAETAEMAIRIGVSVVIDRRTGRGFGNSHGESPEPGKRPRNRGGTRVARPGYPTAAAGTRRQRRSDRPECLWRRAFMEWR
jgi:hypothetical protein